MNSTQIIFSYCLLLANKLLELQSHFKLTNSFIQFKNSDLENPPPFWVFRNRKITPGMQNIIFVLAKASSRYIHLFKIFFFFTPTIEYYKQPHTLQQSAGDKSGPKNCCVLAHRHTSVITLTVCRIINNRETLSPRVNFAYFKIYNM